MPVTIKALKKENNGLRNQIDALTKELKNLQARIDGKLTKETSRPSPPSSPVDQAEISKSIEFLGLECDDLNNFSGKISEETSALKANLEVIAEKVDDLAQAIEKFQAYSYGFNVKILGVQECVSNKSALQTSNLCVAIFNKMGAEVSLTDIDIAHRVRPRNPSNRPKPIICKFIRRLAREEVMKRRTAISLVQSREIGLSDAVVLTNEKIVDHLTPSAQELFAAAKSFKEQHQFSYCWTKNGTVYIRRSESSRPLRIKSIADLSTLAQDDFE
ncbi:uncharacterized protein LOC114965747 [Acropora millepora]|uniref:uncharacterized protein LOC114965747 n=1 Tax=Acropora millepora TaxID=45264 RepID=UPI001CF10A94|nr:uncharacterized protein LOC114965747 [Acropora millepora]